MLIVCNVLIVLIYLVFGNCKLFVCPFLSTISEKKTKQQQIILLKNYATEDLIVQLFGF